MQLTEAVENFFITCRAENRSPKTCRTYRDILIDFASFTNNLDVEQLTPQHVQRYMVHLQDRPGRHGSLSTHSLAKYFAVIRTFFRFLHAQELMRVNLVQGLKPPRMSSNLIDILTDEEVRKVMESLQYRPFRDRVMVEFFLDTCVRLDELVHLKLDDVNFENGYCKVFGKGRKERVVGMAHKLTRDLHTYVYKHRKARPGVKEVFIVEHGEKAGLALGYEGVRMMIVRLLAPIRPEGAKRGPHIFRHTGATLYLRNGGSLEGLRILLGHAQIQTTQRYVHLLSADVLAEHLGASPLDHLR